MEEYFTLEQGFWGLIVQVIYFSFLSCKAMAAGLTCTNGKGNGFFLNRETWRGF